jgi:hypothetical protein
MFEITINGIVFETPKGLDELIERFGFNKELSGYISELSGQLEFTGDAYNYLFGLMVNDVAADVTLVIFENGVEVVSGTIFLTDCEVDRMNRVLTTEVARKGYMSIIDQNKQILCTLNVGKSKNGVSIYTNPINNFRIPDINNNLIDDNTGRRGVYLFDAFKTIVEFMSDGQVSFLSDYLDYTVATPTQASLTALFTGRSLRSSAFSTYPSISFKELFDDMNAMYNLAFSYIEIGGLAYVRIEEKRYFKETAQSTILEDVPNVVQSMDRTSFPAKVVFGSSEVAEDKTYLPDLRFLGMNEEEYHLGGQTNIDTELNLGTTTIITDPNIIQDILPTGTSNVKYDKNVCAVVMDLTDINRAKMTENPSSAGDYYLNVFLSNENVALRWFDQIPISIYAFLGAGNNGAYVNLTTPQLVPPNITNAALLSKVFAPTDDFTPPFNDGGNNYSVAIRSFPVDAQSNTPTTPTIGGYYVAPISGVYNFECVMRMVNYTWGRIYAIVMNPLIVAPPTPAMVTQSIILASQRPFGGPTNYGVVGFGDDPSLATPDPFNFTVGSTVYMAAGQYLGIVMMLAGGYDIGSTFEVFDPLGGRWASFYAEKNYLMLSKMTVSIPNNQWQDIKQNIRKPLGYTMNPELISEGWVVQLSRNLLTTETEVTLNSPIVG